MSISKIDGLTSPDLKLDQGLVSEPSQADVDLFSSLMRDNGNTADQPSHLAAVIAETVNARMTSVDDLSRQAMRHMKEAVTGNDVSAITDMSRALSQYSLQMAVTTKVVSKTGQALEKLTNMQ
ncbi:type III secretion system inner rod subunit SctI [Ectopseudomonas hydrolytica]|jgi:type III secretion system YscI/HrpB-like protein|uniref:Type III secretion apparatus protein, YscI/HrpB family n=1 Tax=Ectopseudomonas mendocina (strain ymp) TaxID=399739 RepID=A4XN88_ECTM1|nr:YscI/HrpB family type III secretion apparatus protein [Pseudomonas mendocina DLHK]